MDKYDKYRPWIWWQDISTLFTVFATSFAMFSLLIAVGVGVDMDYIISPILHPIVNVGSVVALSICIIAFVWLIILVVMKARGTHINQKLQQQDFMTQQRHSKEFTEVLMKLVSVLEKMERKMR